MKRLYYSFAVVFFVIVSALTAHAEDSRAVTSTELISGANTIDGQTVAYKGEIIAAIMKRGDHSWINLNDGNNAIGIWCRTSDLAGVKNLGNYKNEGDLLEVSGVFHRACPEHGGELDIHAEKVTIEFEGFKIEERLSRERVRLTIVFFILTIVAVIAFRKRI